MRTRREKIAFRKLRTRKKIFGTPERPRLSVYRSLKHIYAQVIDDVKGHTLVAASSREKGEEGLTGTKAASTVGEKVAKKALGKGIKSVVFDRSSRLYHGRVKALAESARAAGLKF